MSIIMTVVTSGRDAGFTMYVLCRVHYVLVSMSVNRTRVCVDPMLLIIVTLFFIILAGAC